MVERSPSSVLALISHRIVTIPSQVPLPEGDWSLDILSRAFFNRLELTSRISRFAPDQLTQATGSQNSPPWQRRGGRAIKEMVPFLWRRGAKREPGRVKHQ